MPDANALLDCGTDSARRRHAARGETCRACDAPAASTRPEDLAAYVRRLENRNINLQAANARLRADLDAVKDWTRLLQHNQRMAAKLADVDRTFKALLRSRYLDHDALDREHRRIFSASSTGVAV